MTAKKKASQNEMRLIVRRKLRPRDAGPRIEMPLTPRQGQLLRFIIEYIRENMFGPTVDEMGVHLGIRSTNGVTCYTDALIRKGYITAIKGSARSIRVLGLRVMLEPDLSPEGVAIAKLMGWGPA